MNNNRNCIASVDDVLIAINSEKIAEHFYRNIELKEDWAHDNGKKISALANKMEINCSWLIIGVTDSGLPVGKDEKWLKLKEQTISQNINDHLDPIQSCLGIYAKSIDSNYIIIIHIKSPGDVVYWNKKAYKSSGTSIKEMDPDEILKLRMSLPGLIDYTKQPIISQYNDKLLNAFYNQLIKHVELKEIGASPEESLARLEIRDKQVSKILFGRTAYRTIVYDQNEEPIINDKNHGLYKILTDDFIAYIGDITKKITNKNYKFPRRALTEALANSVAHAAYFDNDGDITIEIFSNKIIISNLCLSESTYFANKWFSKGHKTINNLLMEVLRLSRHVDELGRGKNLILAESLKEGKKPPQVDIERAGRYSRWKLTIHGGETSSIYLRLLERSKTFYQDDLKALLACSLALWNEKNIDEIRNSIEGDYKRKFNEVLSTFGGPIFYHEESNSIYLSRWARILLTEGKDSKEFEPHEEHNLKNSLRSLSNRYFSGFITTKQFRTYAYMADTASEKTQSAKILAKWVKDGTLEKISRGNYRFT